MTESPTVHRPAVLHAPAEVSVADAADWLTERGEEITSLRLAHGAVRVHGLPFTTPEEFGVLRDRLIRRPSSYVEKATPRSDYGNGVFTATDFPARREIRLHNENSYATEFPGLLVFGCLVAPTSGGETTVGDMRALTRMVPPDLLDRFRRHGWRLVRNYWEFLGLAWQVAFDTEDPVEVERYALAQRLSVEWVDGRLRTSQDRSAVVRHPVTGDECWFNHVAFWNKWTMADDVRELLSAECGDDLPYRTMLGDGAELDRADVDELNSLYDQVRTVQAWHPGDLLIVDNILMAHGRSPYEGPRQVLVALGEPVDRSRCEP